MINLISTELITVIVVCAIVGVLFIIGLYFIIDKFILAKRKCKKILTQNEGKYEYLHSLLLGQDAQYIQRLEIISRTNLLYGDIYAQYFRRYKEIRDNQDLLVVDILNELKDLLDDKKFKEFKNYYSSNQEIILSFQESVENINRDLYQIIKPEEEARQNVIPAKEKFREVKSKFNQKESELAYVADTINKVFDTIDERFNTYEKNVETALYDEANKLLPPIYKVLDTLLEMINVLPEYIVEVNETIPNLIDDTKREYKRLLNEKYPLESYKIDETLSNIEYNLSVLKTKIKSLKTSGIKEEIEAFHNDIKDIEKSFNNEINSKEIFDKEYKGVNDEFLALENEFIKISNNMIRFKKVYVIDDEHNAAFEELKTILNDVSKDKRRLEIYVHSLTKSPYQQLLNKMKDLDNGNQTLKSKLNAYTNYLKSLKTDCEMAFKLIETQYFKAKEYTRLLNNLNNEKIAATYNSQFSKIFVSLDDIHNIIKTVPINVKKMNQLVTDLSRFTNGLYQALDELLKDEKTARNTILIANRERLKSSEINTILTQAEQLYFTGDYKKSCEVSQEAINHISLKDGVKY